MTKRWWRWLLILLVLAAVAVAVAVGRAVKSRPSAQPSASSAPRASTEQRLEVLPRDVLTVARGELARSVEVSGTIRAVNTAFVKARVAGELRELSVREGDTVRAGQPIGQIDPTEFDWRLRQAEQLAAAAKSQYEIAQRQLANSKALVAQGFISPTALETATSSESGAQASLQAAIAAVELARKARADAAITAPIAGTVSQRLAQPGERVPVDARLLEIVDLSRLELEAAVPPAELEFLRVGRKAVLTIDGRTEPFEATVARINPSAQAGSRTVAAYLALAPHPSLRQGLFARGRIELERRSALLLPMSSVRNDLARPYAVRLSGGRTSHVMLTLGVRGRSASGDEVVELLQGLAEGDRVLAGGLGLVGADVAVRVAEPASAPVAAR